MKVKEESEKAGLKLSIQKMKIMASSHITSCQIDGETMETVTGFLFLCSKITADAWNWKMTAAVKLKDACSLEEKLWPTEYIKKLRHYFANKGPCSQSYGFPSSHVWVWELDHKEGWALKN